MAVVDNTNIGNVATATDFTLGPSLFDDHLIGNYPNSSMPFYENFKEHFDKRYGEPLSNLINRTYSYEPYGNTYRGIFGSWFNKGDIDIEDYIRDQQSRMNDHVLNKEILDIGNQFTAAENQKQRDFEERLASTSYQRAVEDLKRAGLNPILAYSNGGADSPSFGVSTQSSTPNMRSGYNSSAGSGSAEGSLLKTIVDIIGLFYGKGSKPKKTRAIGFRMD